MRIEIEFPFESPERFRCPEVCAVSIVLDQLMVLVKVASNANDQQGNNTVREIIGVPENMLDPTEFTSDQTASIADQCALEKDSKIWVVVAGRG